jgi:two-component system, OmpR family, response regulator MprA
VVEHVPLIAAQLATPLQEEGYAVRCARDGQTALRQVERDPPDLVLADVMMPRLDGVTLAERLRERGDRTPVVLMSAVVTRLEVPGVGFVPKPFDLDRVVTVVNRAVAGAAG